MAKALQVSAICAGTAITSLSLLLVAQRPAEAVSTFNTITAISTNNSSFPASDGGFSLTISNSNSTGNDPGTVNTNSTGLCAWTIVGGGGAGRCGYGTSPSSGVSQFQLSFNAPADIQAFNVSSFEDANISQGSVGFSLDGTNFTDFAFTSAGTVAAPFSAGPNQPIFVRTSGTFSSPLQTGIFRINSFTVQEVPGPLPIFGAAAAYGWSRKLKRKLLG